MFIGCSVLIYFVDWALILFPIAYVLFAINVPWRDILKVTSFFNYRSCVRELLLNFVHKHYLQPIKINDTTVGVPYVWNSVVYRLPITVGKLHPPSILSVVDDDNKDVTTLFLQYLGPSNDFHSLLLTPKSIGFDSLTITTLYRTKHVRGNEIIHAID